MDQNKNRGQQSQDRNEPQTPVQNPTRDQPEVPRQSPEPQKPQTPPERGRKSKRERNSSSAPSGSSGISNRGMDPEEEQEDLPARGSRQSER